MSNPGLGSVTRKPESWIPDTEKKKIVSLGNARPNVVTIENVA